VSLPELEELRERLATAREREPVRPRLRHLSRPVLAVALLLATAVPAVATRAVWAPLAAGPTPVPPLAPSRTVVASGDGAAGPWRLEGYRARLRGGTIGTCLFVSSGGSGAGACSPLGRRPFIATHRAGPVSFALVGAAPGTSRVTARWADGRTQRAEVRTAALRGGGRVRFALLQRSGGRGSAPALRSVAVAP